MKGVFYAAISSKTQTFAAIVEAEGRTRDSFAHVEMARVLDYDMELV